MKADLTDDRAVSAASTPPQAISNLPEDSPAKLRRRLAGDLDDIVLMALRKESDRRYSSVEQLAEDIRKHLDGRPVTARKSSWTYKTGKFIRRHKTGMAAAALILIAVTGGITATFREARIAAANQKRAEKRFNDVRKLANSLMFEIHDSIQDLPGATSARKLIVQRSQEYLDTLAQEATGDSSLQRELASAYERLGAVQGDAYGVSMGDAAGALQSLQKSLSIRQGVARANPQNSDDQVALARAYGEVARVQWLSLGKTRDGLENVRQAVAVAEGVVHKDPRNLKAVEILARGYQYLGDIEGGSGLRGSTAELRDALENHRRALPLLQEVAGASPSEPEKQYLLARATLSTGDDYVRVGEPAKALDYYQQAEKIIKPVAESGSSSLYRRGYAICHTRMGDALLMLGNPSEALAHYRTELQLLQPLAAADPKDMVVQTTLVTAEGDVAHALVEAGQVAQGKAAILKALARTVVVIKQSNDSYAQALLASTEALAGEACERSGNAMSAQPHYAHARDLYSALASADPDDAEDAVNVVVLENHLAGAELKTGQAAAAMRDYETARERVESMAAPNPDNVEVLYARADTLAGLGDVNAAQAKAAAEPARKLRHWREARSWYAKSFETWQKVPTPGPVSPNGFRAGDSKDVARKAHSTEKLADDKN